MANVATRIRQEWLLVAEIVVLGLFAAGDASGVLKTFTGRELDPSWVFVGAIVIIGATALVRLSNLRDELERERTSVRVAARLTSLAANDPDPGPGMESLKVHVSWEIWVSQDASTDRLALNLIYLYDRPWWQLWRQRRLPKKGVPRMHHDTSQYRKQIRAADPQPFQDDDWFEYLGRSDEDGDPHWLIELVLITGVPPGRHMVPVFIDYDELRSRGTNPPL